jgi:hypothetical protein
MLPIKDDIAELDDTADEQSGNKECYQVIQILPEFGKGYYYFGMEITNDITGKHYSKVADKQDKKGLALCQQEDKEGTEDKIGADTALDPSRTEKDIGKCDIAQEDYHNRIADSIHLGTVDEVKDAGECGQQQDCH